MSEKLFRLAVIVRDGIVQAVVSDQPAADKAIDVYVIDLDTEGADPADLFELGKRDFTRADAFVSGRQIEPSEFIFEDIEAAAGMADARRNRKES